MTQLFLVFKNGLSERLENILKSHLQAPFEIKRTENGKPYIEGNPLFFSITHSGDRALVAISNVPVGVDLEVFNTKKYSAVLESFSANEKLEILSDSDFLFHWTAREAFIKMRGGTLAEDLKRIEFLNGEIYFDGIKQTCEIQRHNLGFGVAAVCVEINCKPNKDLI